MTATSEIASELSRSAAWSLLIEGVTNDEHCPRLLRDWSGQATRHEGSRNTFRTLEKLWGQKRAELLPNAPDTPFTNGKKGGAGKKYITKAVLALKGWLTMPEGHYGTGEQPTRDVVASAKRAECSDVTIVNNLRDKGILDWSRDGRGKIRTFTIADVDDFKSKHADGINQLTLKDVAKKLGTNKQKIRAMLNRGRKEDQSQQGIANGNGKKRRQTGAIVIEAEPKKLRQRCSGPDADTITAEEFQQLEEMMKDQQRKPGFATLRELQNSVSDGAVSVMHEVRQCVELWYELGPEWLPGEKAIVETTYTPKHRSKPQTRTVNTMTYKQSRFKDLWNGRCKVKAGVDHLILELKIGTPRPVPEINDIMKQKGFTGLRFLDAKQKANVVARLPDGEHGGAAWLYERIDRNDKKEPIDAKKIIKDLFDNGPLLVNAYETSLENKGLSRFMGAVKRAEAELRLESKRIGFNSGPWVCRVKGQEWPSKDKAARMAAEAKAAAVEETIPPVGSAPAKPNSTPPVEGQAALEIGQEPSKVNHSSCDNSRKKRKGRHGPYKGARVASILTAVENKLKEGWLVMEACQEVADDRGESLSSVRRTYYRYRPDK
jgi:hypothetical protein